MPVASGIHYVVSNPKEPSASRPPVILIHGAGGSYLSWHPYLRRLADTTVYTLDLPGHGESEGEVRGSIEEYADDVAAFMDALKIEKGIIAGLSMGSAIALMLTLRHPQKVKALAMVGGGSKLRVAKTILDLAENPDTFEAAVKVINANSFSANIPLDLIQLSKKSMLAIGSTGLVNDFRACDRFDVTDQLARIEIPTLIVCGSEDVMTPPKLSRFLNEQIPQSHLHIVDGAGHMVTLEQPEVVAKLLKQFLDTLPPLP